MTKVIGITGTIGSGKTTAAKMLAAKNYPVFYADDYVRTLRRENHSVQQQLMALFPGATIDEKFDEAAFINAVFENFERIAKLETILHPLVLNQAQQEIEEARKQKADAIILDVPKLYESGMDALCDVVIVVTAAIPTIEQRVLQRPNMTSARLELILNNQMPVEDKINRADFMVSTDHGPQYTEQQLLKILESLT